VSHAATPHTQTCNFSLSQRFSQSLLRPLSHWGNSSSPEFPESLPSGGHFFHASIESFAEFPEPESENSSLNSGFWNLEQYPAPGSLFRSPASSTPLPSLLSPLQEGAIDQAVEDLLGLSGNSLSTGGNTIGDPTLPFPSNSPSSSTQIQSTTIICSWPTCGKVFESRSDYKYVAIYPFSRFALIYLHKSSLQIPQPPIPMRILPCSTSHEARS
jgi:hypothetical protein